MNKAKFNFKQTITQGVHYFKDMLGLPVNYTNFEFSSFKKSVNWSSLPHDRESVLSMLFGSPASHIRDYVDEAEEIVIAEKNDFSPDVCKGVGNPMGKTDRITLYAVIRASKPKVVVETGTAAGASSAYILAALEKNGKGYLYSVDIEHKARWSGHLIPDYLRARVQLITGDSLSVLSNLMKEIGHVDFFLHDSLHTYAHMIAEYEIAYQHMRRSGVICSHDVLLTNAWKHFIKRHCLRRWGLVKNLGMCLIEN